MAKKEKSGKSRQQHLVAELTHALSVHHYPSNRKGEEDKVTVELSLEYSGTIARGYDIIRRLRKDADEIESLVRKVNGR